MTSQTTHHLDHDEIQVITAILYGNNIFQENVGIIKDKVDELMILFETKYDSEPEYIRPLILLAWIESNNYSLTSSPKALCQKIMNKLNPTTNVFCLHKPNNADTISQYINDETKSFVDTFTLFSTRELEFYGYGLKVVFILFSFLLLLIGLMDSLSSDPLKATLNIILNALSLIVALAWNSAFDQYFKSRPALKSHGPWMYAIAVTIIVVVILFGISKLNINA